MESTGRAAVAFGSSNFGGDLALGAASALGLALFGVELAMGAARAMVGPCVFGELAGGTRSVFAGVVLGRELASRAFLALGVSGRSECARNAGRSGGRHL